MEIEAKFRVTDSSTFAAILALSQIGPFQLQPEPQPEHQHNRYFDTADKRLRAQRYGLRIRDLGARRIATLKGSTRFHAGVSEREELEQQIGNDDHPEQWPPGELRERVLALLNGASLEPLLQIDTERRHIYAFRAEQRVAEISLDEGCISAGGRQQRLRELEVELLDDASRADFDALVAALRQRFALEPEEQSKLARGIALLDEQ